MSGEDVQPASLKKDEEGAGPSEAAAEAGTDDENGSVLDKAARSGVAARRRRRPRFSNTRGFR